MPPPRLAVTRAEEPSLVITLSIAVRLIAFCWSLTVLRRLRDWRFAGMSLMLGLMATRQLLTLAQNFGDAKLWQVIVEEHALSELSGLAVSGLALFATITVARMLTEQRTMLDELRASEQRFANAIRVVAMGSCEVLLTERRLQDTRSLEQLLHVGTGALEGPQQLLLSLLTPEDGALLAASIAAMGRGERDGFDLLCQTARADGSPRDLHVRAQRLTDPSHAGRAILVMADVGQQLRIQRAVEVLARGESSAQTVEDRLHELAAALARELPAEHVLIGRLTDDGEHFETLAVIREHAREHGFTYSLRGTPCEGVVRQGLCIHESGVQEAFPGDEWLRQMNVHSYAGVPLRGEDGEVFGILTAMSEDPIADDRVSRTLLQVFSIRVANELRRLRDDELAHRSRFAMDHAGDAIFIIDQDARLVDVNETACRRLGYTREQLLAMGVGDVDAQFPMELWPQHWQELRERGTFRLESVHRRSDGTTFPVELVVAHMQFRGAEHNCALARDISYRQHAVAERERLEAELRHAQKMEAVGTLAGGIAHDFNNLLTAVFGNLDLAMMELDDPSRLTESLQALRRVAEQGVDMTRSLLMFAHKAPSARCVIDLHKELLDAARMLRRLLPSSIELQTPSANGPPICVDADPTQVKQVLMNLAVNAQQAMPDGGQLRIDLREETREDSALHHAVIGVEDTGSGMDEATVGRIFEPFFTTRARGQGTGLGLAIVHGIVHDHGGSIRVSSQPGIGTRFEIRLPVATNQPTAELDVAPTARSTLRIDGATVLVAEDNEAVRRLLAGRLQAIGCNVLEADDGLRAIERFDAANGAVELAVLDLDMPKLGGLSCCEMLRTRRPGLPVIAMSGNARLLAEAAERLQVPTLAKPFRMHEMLELVRAAMAGSPAE